MGCCKWQSLRRALLRKRVFEPEQLEGGSLRRCLTRCDLTALGLGSTLGVGVYVLVGYVALHLAGPSIVLSFLIAAVASLCAGLCYAEFSSRVPRAGAAYIYTYVTVGELAAFIVGWNNILEYLFSAASIAKGLSMYLDVMVNNTMSEWYTSVAPMSLPHLSPYFDLLAFLIIIAIGILLAVGVRESTMVNNVMSLVNMVVILFIVVAGAVAANPSNWNIPASEVPPNHGLGGFFPYGVLGTLRGAAVCFCGFVGFDIISATSEEAKEPRYAVPYTILTVLGIALVSYISVAIVVTMMVPYYLQNSVAAVAMAFTHVGWNWANWIVSIGAFFGIFAGLFSAMFPLPRLLYAMSSDGLLLHWCAKVSQRQKSPVVATLLSTAIIAILAGIMELEQLVMMLCIGTLMSYTVVAICVIILRYRSDYMLEGSSNFIKRIFGCGGRFQTRTSARIIYISMILFICLCLSTALVSVNVEAPVVPASVLHALAIIVVVIMAVQPKIKEGVAFKTPLVPLIPCLSIYVNIHLMVLINVQTWIRVGIWILIGIPIYFLCMCCYKRKKDNLQNNIIAISNIDKNGKPSVQIVVESPTPPDTITRFSNYEGDASTQPEIEKQIAKQDIRKEESYITDEIVLHQAYIENNEEKEAKIIDLLDQVLQAEEDTYGEIISLKEPKDDDIISTVHENVVHRKSLGELSDAGSDASLGNQGLSKYDVIAQVHREDLPKVNEEEERLEKEDEIENINNIEEHEQVTAFNDSESNSRTDESGYSDTIDRNAICESLEESKEEIPYIPVPPPLDENYFNTPKPKRFYSLSSKNIKPIAVEDTKPRESVTSNNSQSEDNMTFGSDRQIHFMSKLNNIFQNKITPNSEEEPRRRSLSTGNVVENAELTAMRERPPLFLDLQKELMTGEAANNLRPVSVEETKDKDDDNITESQNESEDTTLSREDLKSKLESIFAIGGPQLLKPRLMKSNPPTPEESYQTDTSSTESIPKFPKTGNNDTLKRQKAKFGDVLNSIRLSFNKDDDV